MKKYVFFDLDGTLTDPALGITNSIMYALEQFGMPIPERSELYKFIGPPLVEALMKEYGFSRERAETALANYRVYFKDKGIFENKVYDGIESLLKLLSESGIKIVLATSKPEPFAITILEHFGLAKYFTLIGGNDMSETRATKEAVLLYDIEKLGIDDLSTCVMVGDRCYDAEGAAKVGMDCVGVLYGYGDRAELENAGMRYIAENVADLQKILLEI